jgi:hypothetical protein
MEVILIEAVLLPNDEVIHFGKTLGFINKKQRDLVKSKATKIARGGEMIIALRPNIA